MTQFRTLFEFPRRPEQQPDVEWPGHGRFRFVSRDGAPGSYEPVQADWLGSQLDFYPDPVTAELVTAALPTADALLDDAPRWQSEVREVAMRDGYVIWRDSGLYRDPGEPMLTSEEWWDEITLWFVYFDGDGAFEFMLYGGDGPLSGMKFVVRGNVATGVSHATD